MDKIGVGIIGCGNIAETYLRLAPTFRALDVRAVADIDAGAARARAAVFGVRAETVEDLLAADDIAVVVNLTVPAAHFDLTRRILAAGKHAYSEKPFVLTLDDAETLRALAADTGLRVGSAPDTFLGGAHQQARRIIDKGDIGRVIGGTCHVMSHGMEAWHPNPDFFYQPGGGPLLDLGPYYVTNLIHLIGPVKAVTAMTSATFATRTIGSGAREGDRIPVGTPTNMHALLEFQNGAIVTLSASWDVWAHGHRNMELYGAEGSLRVPDPNFFNGDLAQSGTVAEFTPVTAEDHPFAIPNQDDGLANYRCAGLADMATAIADDRPHRCSLELATHAVEVMTAILQAGDERRFVEMTTTCERPAPLSPDEARSLLI